jgi:hypothetical protein
MVPWAKTLAAVVSAKAASISFFIGVVVMFVVGLLNGYVVWFVLFRIIGL